VRQLGFGGQSVVGNVSRRGQALSCCPMRNDGAPGQAATRPAARCARVVNQPLHKKAEGAGNAGYPLHRTPCLIVRHGGHTGPPEHPAFPFAMDLTAYVVPSPATNLQQKLASRAMPRLGRPVQGTARPKRPPEVTVAIWRSPSSFGGRRRGRRARKACRRISRSIRCRPHSAPFASGVSPDTPCAVSPVTGNEAAFTYWPTASPLRDLTLGIGSAKRGSPTGIPYRFA
jgi:hypothetical protein